MVATMSFTPAEIFIFVLKFIARTTVTNTYKFLVPSGFGCAPSFS